MHALWRGSGPGHADVQRAGHVCDLRSLLSVPPLPEALRASRGGTKEGVESVGLSSRNSLARFAGQSQRPTAIHLRKMLSDPIFKGQIKLYIARGWVRRWGATSTVQRGIAACSGKVVDRIKNSMGGGGAGFPRFPAWLRFKKLWQENQDFPPVPHRRKSGDEACGQVSFQASDPGHPQARHRRLGRVADQKQILPQLQ